jgi:LmbE family N-acetylglucosaminyl deacetylase
MLAEKILILLMGFSLIGFTLLLSFLWIIRRQLQDDSIPVKEQLTEKMGKVMFIFPHPDDEITCAGTLKKLDEQGIETILLTLTKGEAGPTSGLINEANASVKKAKLAQLREQELHSVGKLLGIDYLEILDFPDGGIQNIASEQIKATLLEKINYYQPSIIVSYDDRIGLYGHQDHILVARYLKELWLESRHNPNFSPSRLYQVTLPKPMIQTALKISETFQKNYPNHPEDGLPFPSIAINITQFGSYKRQAIETHRSQKDMLNDLQPYYDKFPPFIYFWVFDKEYFTEVNP